MSKKSLRKNYFKLNFAALELFESRKHRRTERIVLIECCEAIQVLCVLLQLMDIGISEEIYNKMADSNKKYFKLVKNEKVNKESQ